MRNKKARELLEKIPQETKDKVRKWADLKIKSKTSIIAKIKLWWFNKTNS